MVQVSEYMNQKIIEEYQKIHNRRDVGMMIGEQVLNYIWNIQDLTFMYPNTTMLDFGCGKAWAHSQRKVSRLWDVDKVILYDIGIPQYSKRPTHDEFQSLISIDVLEHIPEDDIDEVFKYWYHRNMKYVFATIAAYPARATLSDGTNAHINLNDKAWWMSKIKKHITCHTEIIYMPTNSRKERVVFKNNS